jgi:spindle assembly abnormal protein 6
MAQLSAIYAEDVRVRLRQGDREDSTQTLCLKISGPAVRSPGSIGGKLVLELTSETDLLFYYSASITESDFHALKQEQRLLVDLHQFPEMVRQLVRLPNAAVTMSIIPNSEESLLTVTEASQFRELTHLSIKLKKGSDEAIKTFLASRLSQLRTNSVDLESRVDQLTRENTKLLSDREMFVTELTKLRVDTDTSVAAIQATCRAQLAELREDHAKEIRDLHLTTSSDYSCEAKRLIEEVREKDARIRELERRLDDTRVVLMSTENACKNAQVRVSSLEQQLERRDTETRDVHVQLRTYEQRISDLSSEIVNLRREAGTASSMVPSEIAEKDALIGKLQLKNKELKRVLRETQHALLEQEKVVASLTKEVEEARVRLTESSGLSEELKRMQTKLTDSQQVIDSNSKIISYLSQASHSRPLVGLSSPITTPTLIPDYPNRSWLLPNMSAIEPDTTSVKTPPPVAPAARVFKGPVKFTPRVDSKEPLLK